MKADKLNIFGLFCLLSLSILGCTGWKTDITGLKTAYRTNPLGTDMHDPQFSWIIESGTRSWQQSAYEIIVSDNQHDLQQNKGNCWSSGKVKSHRTFAIVYAGRPLVSYCRYFWKVRVWDSEDKPVAWSKTAWFETAMTEQEDWKAAWISSPDPLPLTDSDFYKENPAPVFRKEFKLSKPVRLARLYITGLGYYEAFLNGRRVGDQVLDPGWTAYRREVLYSTYDVTRLLSANENAIGVMLGNGWYNPLPIRLFSFLNLREHLTVGKPCLRAQLRIEFTDGTSQTILTDQSWKCGYGPVLKNSVYLGEWYDARKEQEGWNKPAFDDKAWKTALTDSGPGGIMVAQYQPPVRITKILKAIRITEPRPGVYIVDLGQNFAGVPRLHVKGPAGTIVKMRCGEDLHPDGSLNYLTTLVGQLKAFWGGNGGEGCPKNPVHENTYVLKGNGMEVYSPHFTFHSFRYVEVTGLPAKPTLNTIEGLRMNSDLTETGSFECSSELLNKVQQMIRWTFLSNVFSVQSDCPAREKFGYGGDIVATAPAFCYNFDMSSFYRKTVRDFANDARPLGGMTETAPYNGLAVEGIGDNSGSPGWQLAFPFAMEQLYNFYGDTSLAASHYAMLKRQVDFLHARIPGHIENKDIGDHESLDAKPIALSATAFYYHHVMILVKFAGVLHKTKDLPVYQSLADSIRNAFIRTFLKPGTGIFDSGTQAAQAIALYYNLVPEKEREAAFNRLIAAIEEKKEHLSTGIFGTRYIFDVLGSHNRNDVAYRLATQPDFPGYGYMLSRGATTLYENWAYPDTVGSQNHPMFGSVSEWFYRSLIGIRALEPGFTAIEIKPQPAGDLKWVIGHYDAVTGRITCNWKDEGSKFYMHIAIPANTTAVIYIPSLPDKPVMVRNIPIEKVKDLKFREYKDGYAVYDAGGGKYNLMSVIR
jgi:alpha-L-rhamnosidase